MGAWQSKCFKVKVSLWKSIDDTWVKTSGQPTEELLNKHVTKHYNEYKKAYVKGDEIIIELEESKSLHIMTKELKEKYSGYLKSGKNHTWLKLESCKVF